MIARDLTKKLKAMVAAYPVTTLTGPRQSGKSTLVKATFPDYEYVSLEDLAGGSYFLELNQKWH